MRPNSEREAVQTGPRFLCRGTGGVARMVFVPNGRHIVGREPSATLSFDDPDVSRRHAIVTVQEGAVTITDAGSKNGVWIEGHRLAGTRKLIPGDRVEVGSVSMTFDDPEHRIDKWLIMHGEVTATEHKGVDLNATRLPGRVRSVFWPVVALVCCLVLTIWLWI